LAFAGDLRVKRCIAGVVLGFGLSIVAGCSGGSGEPESVEKFTADRPIVKALQLYGSFKSAHGRAPNNIDELKAFAKKLPKDRLQTMGITDVDAALTSPRDNQPYVIAQVPRDTPGGMPRVAIYEKVGQDGKRWTASGMGSFQEMDETTLRQFVPNLQ
jgi:hypothetical protein